MISENSSFLNFLWLTRKFRQFTTVLHTLFILFYYLDLFQEDNKRNIIKMYAKWNFQAAF